MIHAYSWPTSNGKKLHIMLEECGLDYEMHPIRIGEGDQRKLEYVKINPNAKIPAIVDEDGPAGAPITIFESGAILIYLARKTGRFLPDPDADPVAYYEVLQWLMWQMGGVGPMFGQAGYFRVFAKEEVPHAVERYTNEALRLYGVADRRLGDSAYLGGDDYTIADIATYPWLANYPRLKLSIDEFANVRRWMDEIEARPGVQAGLKVLAPPQ